MSQPVPGATPAIKIRTADTNSLLPPPQDLSTTPGGTIYSTTPGGTRIVYDRNALLFLRNSPLSKTPPNHLAFIPGVTGPPETSAAKQAGSVPVVPEKPSDDEEEDVFKMD